MSIHPIVGERKLEALRHALGPNVLDALADPHVVEILANPDGRLVLDRIGSGRLDTGLRLEPEARERVVRMVADYVGDPVTERTRVSLACCLPLESGSRVSSRQSPPLQPSPSGNARP